MSLSIIKQRTTITNAQYIALQTTPIEVVPAPGSGFRNNFLYASLSARFATAAYTGAISTNAWLSIVSGVGNRNVSSYLANNDTGSRVFTYLSTFNDATNKWAALVPAVETADADEEFGMLTTCITAVTGDNEALFLKALNGGSNFGGGNAANSLIVDVLYTVLSLT